MLLETSFNFCRMFSVRHYVTCLVLLCISKGKKNLNSVTGNGSRSLVNQGLQEQLMKAMELCIWGLAVPNLSIDLLHVLTEDTMLPNVHDSCSLKLGSQDHLKLVSTAV